MPARKECEPLEGFLELYCEAEFGEAFWSFSCDPKELPLKLSPEDELTIYEPESRKRILFQGKLPFLIHCQCGRDESAMWKALHRMGIAQYMWEQWFFEEYPACLMRAQA